MSDHSARHQEQAGRGVPEHGFVRGLGLLDCTMLVAGSMIGSGIFIVSADIARQVGSPGWLLTAQCRARTCFGPGGMAGLLVVAKQEGLKSWTRVLEIAQ